MKVKETLGKNYFSPFQSVTLVRNRKEAPKLNERWEKELFRSSQEGVYIEQLISWSDEFLQGRLSLLNTELSTRGSIEVPLTDIRRERASQPLHHRILLRYLCRQHVILQRLYRLLRNADFLCEVIYRLCFVKLHFFYDIGATYSRFHAR